MKALDENVSEVHAEQGGGGRVFWTGEMIRVLW